MWSASRSALVRRLTIFQLLREIEQAGSQCHLMRFASLWAADSLGFESQEHRSPITHTSQETDLTESLGHMRGGGCTEISGVNHPLQFGVIRLICHGDHYNTGIDWVSSPFPERLTIRLAHLMQPLSQRHHELLSCLLWVAEIDTCQDVEQPSRGHRDLSQLRIIPN